MKMYRTPNILLLNTSEYILATTQSAGEGGQAAFTAACNFSGCQDAISGSDSSDFIVSWEDSDNDASDAGNYIVTVNINGDVFAITEATLNCNFSFGPAFQVSCQDFDSGSDGCIFAGLNTLTIVSIEDPQGNVFSPSGEDCTFQNEQG